MTPPTPYSRTLGAILGVHSGDSLGATCEFMPWSTLRKRYPSGVRDIVGGGPFGWKAGHATDDTDLTRAVALAYRDVHRQTSNNKDVAVIAGEYMLDWSNGNWPSRTPGTSPIDIGGATSIGLGKFAETKDPDKSGAGFGQAGNGSLMRCIPTALFQSSPDFQVEESIRISKITHDDPRCTISCAAYNAIVASLVAGNTVNEAIKVGEELASRLESKFGGHPTVTLSIQKARNLKVHQMAEEGPNELQGKGAGYVLESLIIAISALLDERSLEDVLVDVVRIGKDTDTNGAIAGGLLGARDGVEAIPERWREKLQFRQEFEDLVKELVPQ